MNWYLLAIIGVLTVSISSILQKILMKDDKSDPFVYGFFFNLFCSILIFLFALNRGFVFPSIKDLPGNYLLEAILYAAFIVYLFKALKYTEASRVTILTTTSSFWTIAIAVIFLGENFNLQKLLGALLIFLATFIVTFKGRKEKFNLDKGSLYALIAAFCFGLAFANDAFILSHKVNAISYTAVSFFLPSIIILLAKPQIMNSLQHFLQPKIILKMSLLGLFYSVSAAAVYSAYQLGGNVSQLAPIGQSRVVLTVILAALFLNERSNFLKNIFAAILVSLGVLLLR